jgi:hypothetical protein
VLHDRAQDRGLQVLPLAIRLGDGHEVGAIEHAGDAGHGEQPFGERRAGGGFAIGKLHRAALEHHAAWNEFQGGGIGGGFGLDEHCFSPASPVQGRRVGFP